MPADEIVELESSEPSRSMLDIYESMPSGPDRLQFFQTNRRALEKAFADRVGN